MLPEGWAYTWNVISDCFCSQDFKSIAWKSSISNCCGKGTDEEVTLASVEAVEEGVIAKFNDSRYLFHRCATLAWPLCVAPVMLFHAAAMRSATLQFLWVLVQPESEGEAGMGDARVSVLKSRHCQGENPMRERIGMTLNVPLFPLHSWRQPPNNTGFYFPLSTVWAECF